MRRRLIVLCPLLLAGCCPRGTVDADALLPAARRVVERHDRYVEADPDLSPEDRATYRRTSELLVRTLEEAAASDD